MYTHTHIYAVCVCVRVDTQNYMINSNIKLKATYLAI